MMRSMSGFTNGLGFLLAITLLAANSLIASPSFIGIEGTTVVRALNADGNIAAAENYPSCFRWDSNDGLVDIGHLTIPGYGPNHATYVGGMSADGTVIVGSSSAFSYYWSKTQAYRWTPQEGMTSLVELSVLESQATGVSDDGRNIAGWISDETGQHAVLWRDGQEVLRLEAGTVFWAISRNGVWATGTKAEDSQARAFRWSLGTGLEFLGEAAYGCYGRAISEDGSVVVGQGAGTQPFRWTVGNGMESLGAIIAGEQGYATTLSDDGTTVGGVLFQSGAFLWTEANGLRGLKHVLQTDHGMDLANWTLNSVWAISGDGRVVAGGGFKQMPFPVEHGFIAKLGELSIPRIALTRESGSMRLEFSGVLQSSLDLADWQDVEPRPSSPYTLPPTEDRRFFRARSH